MKHQIILKHFIQTNTAMSFFPVKPTTGLGKSRLQSSVRKLEAVVGQRQCRLRWKFPKLIFLLKIK
jgi:hypothetical protein